MGKLDPIRRAGATPSVVPTIFLLQWRGLYKTVIGLIFVEVANFISQFGSRWNLLFANVVLITILPLIV